MLFYIFPNQLEAGLMLLVWLRNPAGSHRALSPFRPALWKQLAQTMATIRTFSSPFTKNILCRFPLKQQYNQTNFSSFKESKLRNSRLRRKLLHSESYAPPTLLKAKSCVILPFLCFDFMVFVILRAHCCFITVMHHKIVTNFGTLLKL